MRASTLLIIISTLTACTGTHDGSLSNDLDANQLAGSLPPETTLSIMFNDFKLDRPEIAPGEPGYFGTWDLNISQAGITVNIDGWDQRFYVSETGLPGSFVPGNDNGVAAEDYILGCELIDAATGEQVTATLGAPSANGAFVFTSIQVGTYRRLHQWCYTSSTEPNGRHAFAVNQDFDQDIQDAMTVTDQYGRDVVVNDLWRNGTEYDPELAVVIEETWDFEAPCLDPDLFVTHDDFQPSVGVRRETEVTYFAPIICSDDEAVTLDDLRITVASDDKVKDLGFDQLPTPAEHLSNCEVFDSYGNLVANVEYFDSYDTVSYEAIGLQLGAFECDYLVFECDNTAWPTASLDPDRFGGYIDRPGDIAATNATGQPANICYSNGLPNGDLNSFVGVRQSGRIEISTVVPANFTVSPGATDVHLMDIEFVGRFEDLSANAMYLGFSADDQIIDAAYLSYTDSDGDPRLDIGVRVDDYFFFQPTDIGIPEDVLSTVELYVDIALDAEPGESTRPWFVPEDSWFSGDTSLSEVVHNDLVPSDPTPGAKITVE